MFRSYLSSPVGTLEIHADEHALLSVQFCDSALPAEENALTRETRAQLNAYFLGELMQFDLPLKPTGTAFQQQVWQQLIRIPYAETCSYKEVAEQVGQIKAMRAVGAANGRNPIAIIVPCHRVIGSNGRLTGYAGGLQRKAWLLEHEARCAKPAQTTTGRTGYLL